MKTIQTVPAALSHALPSALEERRGQPVTVDLTDDQVVLKNGFVAVTVSTDSATVVSVHNKLTDSTFAVADDSISWRLSAGLTDISGDTAAGDGFAVRHDQTDASVVLRLSGAIGGIDVTVSYVLDAAHFWVERRVVLCPVDVASEALEIQEMVYGRCTVPGANVEEHQVGEFDVPRFIARPGAPAAGGLFTGMCWWFYEVAEDGACCNTDMQYPVGDTFESDPWYIGVFQDEPAEPWTGWLWYKAFLQIRKDEYDKHPCWFSWNAGWGHWGIDMDDPDALQYLDLCEALGFDAVVFGSGCYGKLLEEDADLIQNNSATIANFRALVDHGLVGGSIESGARARNYDVPEALNRKRNALKILAANPGFGVLAYDFFYIDDNFRARRMAAEYLREARELLEYTECHLGMAKYGPQYQREVQINHPADLEKSDMSLFSSDWLTWLAFRVSRAKYQQTAEYLLPESGLYYFTTHYHNGGHPRKYSDPEPAQIIYKIGAYCGCAFNFHDRFGFHNAAVATAAFSPYLVFGYLDPQMSATDIAFSRSFSDWVRENVQLLRKARICQEDNDTCVVSKIMGNSGALFLLNYTPGEKTFNLDTQRLGLDTIDLRPVYPHAGDVMSVGSDGIEITLPGESVSVYDVNNGLVSDPPQSQAPRPIELEFVESANAPNTAGAGRLQAEAHVPAYVADIGKLKDDTLPEKLLIIDLLGFSIGDLGTGQQVDPDLVYSMGIDTVTPDCFWDVYDTQDNQIDTWKLAPWAFADRVFLTLSFADNPPLLTALAAGEITLAVNGVDTVIVPRIEHRKPVVEEWDCPLIIADVTELLIPGASNTFQLTGVTPSSCTAALRMAALPRADTRKGNSEIGKFL